MLQLGGERRWGAGGFPRRVAERRVDGRVPVRGCLLRGDAHRVVRTHVVARRRRERSRRVKPRADADALRDRPVPEHHRGQRGWHLHARVRIVRGGVVPRARDRELVVETGRAATKAGRGHRRGAGEPVERHGAHARGRTRRRGFARGRERRHERIERHEALES